MRVCHCDSAYSLRFVGKSLAIIIMDIFLNQLIQFYLNNTMNLRHLTQRIISCYTHKMALVSYHRLWDVSSSYVSIAMRPIK